MRAYYANINRFFRHKELCSLASHPDFARRRLFDARTALILIAFGVKEFATANTKDFEGLGFDKIWNPLINPASELKRLT